MRWLLFDAVGTLIAPREPVAVTYHAVGAKHGSQLSFETVRDRFQHAFGISEGMWFAKPDEMVPPFTCSEEAEQRRWQWVVRSVFEGDPSRGIPHLSELPPTSLDDVFAELWQHYAQPSAWTVLPDVALTLRVLRRRGYLLGVASNFDSRLDAVLAGLPELMRFDKVFVSSRVGYRKPAPEFYEHVIAECGGNAEDMGMIGDHLYYDYIAPQDAGMTVWHFNPDEVTQTSDSIHTLTDLLARLPEGDPWVPLSGGNVD